MSGREGRHGAFPCRFSRSLICRPAQLARNGYISTELGPRGENVFLALAGGLRKGPRVRFPIPAINAADVAHFRRMAEAGTLRPLIDRVVDFDTMVEAHRYVETGEKIGNVVVRVVPEEGDGRDGAPTAR